MPLARDVMRCAASRVGEGPAPVAEWLAEDGMGLPEGPWDAAFVGLSMAMAGQECPGLPSPTAAGARDAMGAAGLAADAPETGDVAFHGGRMGLVELSDGESAQLVEGDVGGVVARVAVPASEIEAVMRPPYDGVILTLGYPAEAVEALDGEDYSGTYRCRAAALNVRAEPSVYAGLAGQLREGDEVALEEWHLYADGLLWGRLGADGPYVSMGTPDEPALYLERR